MERLKRKWVVQVWKRMVEGVVEGMFTDKYMGIIVLMDDLDKTLSPRVRRYDP